jgi:outer membrane protein assembly factor BamB
LIVPSCDWSIYALQRRTGKRVWKFSEAQGAYHASPVTKGKTVYVGNDDGFLYAIAEVSGQLRWRADLQSPIWANPLLVPGMVIAGTLDGNLFAVRTTDGTILWRYKAGTRIYLANLIPWREMVLTGTTDGLIHAVQLESGKRAWTLRVGGKIGGGPAVEEDTAYLATTSGLCLRLDLRKRRFRWKRRLRGGTIYPPALTSTSLFVGTGAGYVYALDRKTGEVAWTAHMTGRAGCCNTDGHRVFVCGWNGKVYAYHASQGTPLWELKTGADVRGFPTLLGGWLYIGSLDKAIYALKYL